MPYYSVSTGGKRKWTTQEKDNAAGDEVEGGSKEPSATAAVLKYNVM
jgi:hypothetical protein